MGGAVPPLPQYAFMAWCSVRGSTETNLLYLLGGEIVPLPSMDDADDFNYDVNENKDVTRTTETEIGIQHEDCKVNEVER
jgi:hypothetical protein